MTDYRSKAEEFVTSFLNYIRDYDIKDKFNKQTNKMERSPGVESLIREAGEVFPPRVEDGKKATDALDSETVEHLIASSGNVIDTREMFSRRVARNGGTLSLLRQLYEGKDPAVREKVKEFLEAEDQVKEFAPSVPPEV